VIPPEARWLGARMLALAAEELSPLLDVASSTERFRTRYQPYIDREIFAPLRAAGAEIVHIDRTAGDGVDLVGDLDDPSFMSRLRQSAPRSALVANLLEHVHEPAATAAAIVDVLPVGGYVFVSGPHRYPYHPDPIDNGLRPTVEQLAALFPGTSLVDGEIIEAAPAWRWPRADRGNQSPLRVLARVLLPVYRPRGWVNAARRAPLLFTRPAATAAVLRKVA
jgi:hypothetical protein